MAKKKEEAKEIKVNLTETKAVDTKSVSGENVIYDPNTVLAKEVRG